MTTRQLLSAAILILVISVPGFAQGTGNRCDLSGTWYGGSNPQTPYLWTVSSIGAGRYSATTALGYDAHSLGYTSWSGFSGEMFKTGTNTFQSYGLSYWNWDAAAAAEWGPIFGVTIDPSLPEVDIVRSRVELIDCNTMTSTIDVFAAYFNFTADKTPFVTAPDFDYLSFGPIPTETYHRMPTACPECPYASAASNVTVPAGKLGKGPHKKK